MELILQRLNDTGECTTGKLTVDDLEFVTLEDTNRDINHDGDFDDPGEQKVYGFTRIPCGRYKITLRTEGRMHNNYKNKFLFHKGMLWIRDVNSFSYVYIHIGNNSDDSSGCILVATYMSTDCFIAESTRAYVKLYKYLLPAFESGQEVWIKVIDEVK